MSDQSRLTFEIVAVVCIGSMTNQLPSVLMVTRELYGDRRYGLGRSLMPVVEALIDKGWRVRYLCQEDLPQSDQDRRTRLLERICSWPLIASRPHLKQVLRALAERLQMGWFAARMAREDGYTVVHLHDPWLACGFWLGKKRHRLDHVRWGIVEHGFGCYSRAVHEDGLVQGERLQRWLRRLEAATLRAAGWVIAPTQLALDQLARDLGLPTNPQHWRAIPHAATEPAPMTRAQACDFLGWSPQDVHVLGVGRLVPLKRFDILLAACSTLIKRHPGLHLHLLGDGDRQGLQQQADANGFGDHIHFAVTDDVWPYYFAADVYVSTSVTESFGLANLEALMAGLPCICTAVGGVPEVMGVGAWLIPVDQGVLAVALDELMNNPAQRYAMSERASKQSRHAARLETVLEQYVQLFLQ